MECIEAAKALYAICLNESLSKHGQDIGTEQVIIENLANILIYCYVADSTLSRVMQHKDFYETKNQIVPELCAKVYTAEQGIRVMEYTYKIYPSRTVDDKKNPIDPDMKVSYMRKMFPDYEEQIINDPDMKTIFDVLTTAAEDGYLNVNIIVGADRQSEFENLAQKYNGDLYDFDLIRVISAGVRDADAEGVEGMSASKMRKAVADDDYEAFRKGTPSNLDDGDTTALFNAVRSGMKIKKTKSKTDAEKSAARSQEDEKGKKAAAKRRDYASARSTALDDALKKHWDKHDDGKETEVEKALKKGAKKKKKKTTKESVEIWEIAPSLDQKTLREHYINKDIFNVKNLLLMLRQMEDSFNL